MPHDTDAQLAALLAAPLEVQVAQRMIVGVNAFDAPGTTLSPEATTLLGHGLGGVILFKKDVGHFTDPLALANFVYELKQQSNQDALPLWVGLDEEGGLIERLPCACFPSLPHFRGLAEAVLATATHEKPPRTDLAAECADLQAFYLNLLGINLNFTPTLDCNTEPTNPVIGVRSFGTDADWVKTLGKIVWERNVARNVLPVGKHAPGHGSATVDSHQALPVLHPTAEELAVFAWAAHEGIPALMLAHAVYPTLTKDGLPASLSPAMVNKIRQAWGFNGLLITDDLCMGAITEQHGAVDAALHAITAGVDVLLYREATTAQLAIHAAMVDGLTRGRLDRTAHEAALARIVMAKAALPTQPAAPDERKLAALLSAAAIEATSRHYAQATLRTSLPEGAEELPIITPESCVWLIEPDCTTIPQYAADAEPTLEALLADQHCHPLLTTPYPCSGASDFKLTHPETPPDFIIWARYYPHDAAVETIITQAIAQYPEAAVIGVDAGLPTLPPKNNFHVGLGSYRPPYRVALINHLLNL